MAGYFTLVDALKVWKGYHTLKRFSYVLKGVSHVLRGYHKFSGNLPETEKQCTQNIKGVNTSMETASNHAQNHNTEKQHELTEIITGE